jgi:hypothetical protein
VKKCRALLNRIPFSEKRSMEYHDAIARAPARCSVPLFVTSILSFVSANKILKRTTNQNDLLSYAKKKYSDMINNGDWLPTSKAKSTFSTQGEDPKSDSVNKNKKKKKRGGKKSLSWSNTPPGDGDKHTKKTDDGRTVQWCEKCKR